MSTFKIFYSWQSDLPGRKTRNFIRRCIDDAIAFAGASETIEAIRDEATKDTTGSPNIVTTLFSKIDDCDLFIADVSLCFTGDEKKEQDGKEMIKHSPNPNVLLELGYAAKTLGWERVICLCNTDFGSDYPFDIAQNRRTPYSLVGKDKEVEGFSVKIKTKDQQPQSFALPVQFAIRGKGIKHVQVSVYLSETCAITYHFELMIAGKKRVYKSMIGNARVYVPLYEPEGGYYFKLRDWLMENNIVRYHYNEDRLLQNKIVYVGPQHK